MEFLNFGNWLAENVSDHAAFQRAVRQNPGDMHARSVYADYLQDSDLASEETLNLLRHTIKPVTFVNTPDGKVWAGTNYTMDDIKRIVAGKGGLFFSRNNARFFRSFTSDSVFCGPGGNYFITSELDTLDNERRYTVRKFDPDHPWATISEPPGHDYQKYDTLRQAKSAARKLSLG